MIVVPFLYFAGLLIYTIRKRGIYSIATILVGIYLLTSFCSILIDVFNGYGGNCPKIDINFIPTLLYCILLTISILPFIRVQDNRILFIEKLKSPKILDYIVYFYGTIFLLMVLLMTPDLLRNWILASESSSLKAEFWDGDTKVLSLSGIFLWIGNRCLNFAVCSLNLIPILFYNYCFRHKGKLFLLFNLLATLPIVFSSLLVQDRSKIVYWGMIVILCYAFFQKYMDSSKKKFIKYCLLCLLTLIICYVVIMNLKRYGDNGTFDDSNLFLINYAGQSFINFCNYIENLHLPFYNLDGPFPLINYIFDIYDYNTREWAEYVYRTSHNNILVFSTFIGFIMSYVGLPWTILWLWGFYLLSTKLLKRKCVTRISYFQLHTIFTLINVPFLGVFVYYYHSHITELFTLVLLFLIYLSTYKTFK